MAASKPYPFTWQKLGSFRKWRQEKGRVEYTQKWMNESQVSSEESPKSSTSLLRVPFIEFEALQTSVQIGLQFDAKVTFWHWDTVNVKLPKGISSIRSAKKLLQLQNEGLSFVSWIFESLLVMLKVDGTFKNLVRINWIDCNAGEVRVWVGCIARCIHILQNTKN